MIYEVDLDTWIQENVAIVKTELGEVFLRLESPPYSLRNRMVVYDSFRVPIGKIQKKLFRTRKRYNIYFEDKILAVLRKGRYLFWKKYYIKSTKGIKYRINGDVKNSDFRILNNRKTVADISINEQGVSRRMCITIYDEENAYLLLCVVITLTRPRLKN